MEADHAPIDRPPERAQSDGLHCWSSGVARNYVDYMSAIPKPPLAIAAGRAWNASLFAMIGLALVSSAALAALEPHPLGAAILIVVIAVSGVTLGRGWRRVCDQMTLYESSLTLHTLWPRGSITLAPETITRVWLSPKSGTVRIFTTTTSYVLRLRGDLINDALAQDLASRLPHAVVGRHYNMTLW